MLRVSIKTMRMKMELATTKKKTMWFLRSFKPRAISAWACKGKKI